MIRDDLFRSGSIILIAILFSGIFFYFFHVFVGRILGTAEYGAFGALFSLSFFLQFILLKTITVMVARNIAKFKGQAKTHLIALFHSKIMTYMIIGGIIAATLFLLLSTQIATFLHITSVELVILIGIIFFICWALPVNLGAMQGLQQFNSLAIMNTLLAVLKFIFGIGLVLLGYGIYGAIGGLVLGTIMALIISFYLLRDAIQWPKLRPSSYKDQDHVINQAINQEIKEALRFSIPVLFVTACIAIPTNIDVVLVKHFFTAENAGLFTAVTVFGRMVFSLPVAITMVMYPKVIEAYTKKKDTRKILNRSLLYTGIPAGLAALILWIFPRCFLELFYGIEFLGAGSLLKLYGFFIFFFSLSTVLVYNSLAKKRYAFVSIFAVLSALELGLIWVYHSSLNLVLQILLVTSVIVFIIGLILNYLPISNKKIS